MASWLIFFIAGLLLTLVIIGGLLLPRRNRRPVPRAQWLNEDARILYLLMLLASLSILVYIAFAFGKR